MIYPRSEDKHLEDGTLTTSLIFNQFETRS